MCGIVGGISYKNVLPSLIEGLERLEYRGYDSVGIVINNDSLERELGQLVGSHRLKIK